MDKKNLSNAVELARWLIQEQGVNKERAYIIGAKKKGVEKWADVQKAYNQKYNYKRIIKSKVKQIGLF